MTSSMPSGPGSTCPSTPNTSRNVSRRQHVGRRPVRIDLALFQHHDPLRVARRLVQVVQHHDHRQAVLAGSDNGSGPAPPAGGSGPGTSSARPAAAPAAAAPAPSPPRPAAARRPTAPIAAARPSPRCPSPGSPSAPHLRPLASAGPACPGAGCGPATPAPAR